MNTSTGVVDTARTTGVLLALVAGLASCQGPVLNVTFNLVTQTCDMKDVLTNVDKLTFTVYAPDLKSADFQVTVPVSGSTATIPNIPVGSGRDVVVEGYASDGVKLIARGESGPVDLKQGAASSVTIFMRPVDAFSFANSADKPSVCTALTQQRAGHTATLLSNGKVLIAGGFSVAVDNGMPTYTYLKTTEIFDPATGTITAGPSLKLPRAFHTATELPGTDNFLHDPIVVIAGGEGPKTVGTTTEIDAIPVAEIYDEATNQITTAVPLHASGGRSRHIAIMAPTASGGSQLLLIGGYSNTDAATGMNPLPSGEVFDPNTPSFGDAGFKLGTGLAEAGAVQLSDTRIFVAGGWTGPAANEHGYFLAPTQSGGYQAMQSLVLASPQLWPLMGTLGSGSMAVVAGGFKAHDATTHDLVDGQTTTEFFNGQNTMLMPTAGAALTDGRGWGDSISLPDGTMLAVGGQFTQTSGGMLVVSSATADVFSPNVNKTPPTLTRRTTAGALRQARFLHRLTLLPDGSVLVSGGVDYGTDGKVTMPTRLEIYEPLYVGDNTTTPHSMPQ